MMTKNNDELDVLSINTLKLSGCAAVNKANSGHPGIVLSGAKIMHTLFLKHINYDINHPQWINRDRFVLSAGHGSALLYAQLRILGLISKEDLENFRQLNSKTPGHPEYGHTLGIEATTGPLGQGIAMGVGLALARKHLNSLYNEVNHYTYVLCGDGDLQEGVANEAMQFAGSNQIDKLIILHDSNDIQLDSSVAKTSKVNIELMMKSYGFEYFKVANEVDEINETITKAKEMTKPVFIEVKTIIGEGSSVQGTSKAHGTPLGSDIETLKSNLDWAFDNFFLPEEVRKYYEDNTIMRGFKAFANFKMSDGLKKFLENKKIDININNISKNVATRQIGGEIISWLNNNVSQWIGGSADLSSSTKAQGGDGDFSIVNPKGRNILFGVREFAMGAMANGLALHSNFKVFVSTFLVFSDYIKPAARLAALMKIPVSYIFTHDSVHVGEDGPTHQPIEQLAMLRAIPNFNVLRPADDKETKAAFQLAINSERTPNAIILTRQNIVSLEETKNYIPDEGYYKILNSNNLWTLIATGSELESAYEIAKSLNLNLVSMPLFKNNLEIKDWDWSRTISIECGSTFGWSKMAKFNIGIDTFGLSANPKDTLKALNFDKESLLKRVLAITK